MARLLAFLLVALAVGSAVAATASADRLTLHRVAGNPADALARLPIDDYRYDLSTGCRKHPSRGALALTRWLEGHARGSFWGIMRCERFSSGNFSLHSEGRAVDWHLDVHRPADRRGARRLIALLLAPDRAGTPHALARRMGIQEIIWNCRSWWSGAPGLGRYSPCFDRRGRRTRIDDTSAHRDHLHIGLSRRGARMRTSFWSRRG